MIAGAASRPYLWLLVACLVSLAAPANAQISAASTSGTTCSSSATHRLSFDAVAPGG
jgi:hypothetical protein